jgi:hypothetical protein
MPLLPEQKRINDAKLWCSASFAVRMPAAGREKLRHPHRGDRRNGIGKSEQWPEADHSPDGLAALREPIMVLQRIQQGLEQCRSP